MNDLKLQIKKTKNIKNTLICLLLTYMLLLLLPCISVRAEELSENQYTLRDFCNAECYSHMRYEMFGCYPEKGIDAFVNREASYYIKYNTNTHVNEQGEPLTTGNILVIGSEGDAISTMIANNETTFIQDGYYGNYRPGHLSFTYIEPSELCEDIFDGYDIVIIESSIEDEDISEEILLWLHNKVQECMYIIYDMSIIDPYYVVHGSSVLMTFDPEEGSLVLIGGEYSFKNKDKALKYYSEYFNSMATTEYNTMTYDGDKKYSFSLDDVKDITIIPYHKTTFGHYSFTCFTNLQTINTSSNYNNYIGQYAFDGCKFLEDIDLSNIETIGIGAFRNCSSLTDIEFPASLTKIAKYAFENTGLQEVNLPETLETIGQGSFSKLSNLQELSIDLNEDGLLISKDAFANSNNSCGLSINYPYEEIKPTRTQLFSVFEDNNCNQSFTNLMKYTSEDTVLKYVGCKINEYILTFEPNGGMISGDDRLTVNAESVYPELPVPTKNGFDFLGWFTQSGVQIMAGDSVTIDDNVTLWAKWDNKEIVEKPDSETIHTVTLIDTIGNFVYKTIAVKNGDLWEDYLVATDRSYSYGTYKLILDEWLFENNTVVDLRSVICLEQDICLYTKYRREGESSVYKITFPEYNQSYSIHVGDALDFSKFPQATRNGDTLLGWTFYSPATTEEDIILKQNIPYNYNYVHDIQLYAVWQSTIDNHNITTTETLSMKPIYYSYSEFTDSVYYDINANAYALNYVNYKQEDFANAKWLFNKIISCPAKNNQIMILPKKHGLDLKDYKKYGIIETGWEMDQFVHALACMNKVYFQNLVYTDNIEIDLETLLKNTEWENNKTKKAFDTTHHYVDDFTIYDIDGSYTIDKSIFLKYRGYCDEIDQSLDAVLKDLNFNTSTTVTDAIRAANDWLATNVAYDCNYRIYNLAWMFKTTEQDAWYLYELEIDNGTGNYVRKHHGVCNAYALFATALFAKCGYYAPKCGNTMDPNDTVCHAFNLTKVNGKELFTDYCWSADTGSATKDSNNSEKYKGSLRYLFLDRNTMNTIVYHKKPFIDDTWKTIISFNNKTYTSLKGVKIISLKNQKGKKAELKLKANKNISNIQIYYSTDKKFKNVKKKNVSNCKKVILKKLKKGKTYYIKVRAFRKFTYYDSENDKKKTIYIHGSWSKIKKLRIKK